MCLCSQLCYCWLDNKICSKFSLFCTNHMLPFRTEAMGYVQITSRFGAMLSPWISQWLKLVHWRLPYAAMGILSIVASVFLQCVSETKGEETAETLQQNSGGNKDEQTDLVEAGNLPSTRQPESKHV